MMFCWMWVSGEYGVFCLVILCCDVRFLPKLDVLGVPAVALVVFDGDGVGV